MRLLEAGCPHALNWVVKRLGSNPMANPMLIELTSTYGS